MARKSPAPPRAQTLLVELLTEELPPKSLEALGRALRDHLTNDLESSGLLLDKFTKGATGDSIEVSS